MIKAVLFDFDGVLTLDATGSKSIGNYISKVLGIDQQLFLNEYYKYNKDLLYGVNTHTDIWDELCVALNRDISIDVLYDSFISTPIDFDMLEIVKNLKESGYLIGMITDNKKDRIDMVSKHNDFDSLFDCITISADVGSGKKEKLIFESTFKCLNVEPSECIFIDNKDSNLIVPDNMGVKTILFNHDIRDINNLKNKLNSHGIKQI